MKVLAHGTAASEGACESWSTNAGLFACMAGAPCGLQGFAAFTRWFGANHIHGVSAAQEPLRGITPVAPGMLSLLCKQPGAVFFGTFHIKGNLE